MQMLYPKLTNNQLHLCSKKLKKKAKWNTVRILSWTLIGVWRTPGLFSEIQNLHKLNRNELQLSCLQFISVCVFHDKVSTYIFGNGHVLCTCLKVKSCCTLLPELSNGRRLLSQAKMRGRCLRLAVVQSCYNVMRLWCHIHIWLTV